MKEEILNSLIQKATKEVVYEHFLSSIETIQVNFNKKKFAELLIEECLNAIDPIGSNCGMNEHFCRLQCAKLIKDHFSFESNKNIGKIK